MQTFLNLGAIRIRGDHFLTKPPKGTSLADFTRFEPLRVQIRSRVFFARRLDEKRDTTKSQLRYISPICGEFPTEPNLTKIGIWVEVADLINHTKFGNNDRSREYKVRGGSNFGLLHRNGLSPITCDLDTAAGLPTNFWRLLPNVTYFTAKSLPKMPNSPCPIF